MTPTCVHQQRQEFNVDCIFCREIQQKEAEKGLNTSDSLLTEELGEVISTSELRELMDEIQANEPDLDLEEMERWLAKQYS